MYKKQGPDMRVFAFLLDYFFLIFDNAIDSSSRSYCNDKGQDNSFLFRVFGEFGSDSKIADKGN